MLDRARSCLYTGVYVALILKAVIYVALFAVSKISFFGAVRIPINNRRVDP